MMTFKLVPHKQLPCAQVVEVWMDDSLVAVVYPQEPNAIRVISAHVKFRGPEGTVFPAVYRFDFRVPR